MCMGMGILPVCMPVHHCVSALRGQNGAADALRLDLYTVVSHQVDIGNQTLERATIAFKP